MKKIITAFLVTASLFALSACGTTAGSGEKADDTASAEGGGQSPAELIVFATDSLSDELSHIGGFYKEEAPDVTVSFKFDTSDALAKEIAAGGECDLFLSEGNEAMDSVDSEGAGLIESSTRINLLENKLTLCAPPENPAAIESFDDLAFQLQSKDIVLAAENTNTQAGVYTKEILEHYGFDENQLAAMGKLAYLDNYSEVAARISEGSVSGGIIFASAAYSNGLDVIDFASPDMCGQLVYPIAVMKNSNHSDEAKAFLNYLKTSDPAMEFEGSGFTGFVMGEVKK